MGLGAKVGTAYVDVEGDFTPLERQLQALRAPFVAQGKEFGRSISAGMAPALVDVSKKLLDVGDSGKVAERQVAASFKGVAKSVADSARKIAESVKGAGAESRALGRDIAEAGITADTAFSKADGATAEFHDSLRATKVATSDLASVFGGLVDQADDYVDGLTRAHGITVESSADARKHAAALESLRDHNLTLGDSFGGLVGELRRVGAEQVRAATAAIESDKVHGRFGQALQRIGARLTGAGAGLRTLSDESDDADRSVGRFSRSVGDAGGGIGGLAAGLGGLGGGFSAFGGAVAVGIPLLIGFGASTFAVGAALAPLSGLAAAAAAGLTAAAQGAGVFALASWGLGDAIKEQLTAQGQAATAATNNAVAQRAAARAIQSAEDGVADAKDRVRQAGVALTASHRDEQAATEDLTAAQQDAWTAISDLLDARAQARRNIEDLTAAVADGALSEARATSTLRDARKALADLEAGASADDLADAHRRVTDIVLGETRATQALEAAHKALADLLAGPSADDTADAHEKITDAQREQEKAVLALRKAQAEANAILASSTATDDEKAQARLDLADAEDRVGDATTASARAQKDLNDLEAAPDPKKVQRARSDIAEAEHRVAEARENSTRAQKDLDKLETAADPQALQDARLAIAEAENALADAIRDHKRDQEALNKAEKDGVKNAPEVVAARRALADANDRVADAVQGVADAHRAAETADKNLTRARRDVTRATQDLSDAQANAAAGTAAAIAGAQDLNKELNDLPPAAQAFVRQIVALKPKLDELRAAAAQGLFPGVSTGLIEAMKNFEPVQKVVGETSLALGDLAREAGELVGSPAFGKDLETVGGRNAKTIGTLGDAALHLVDAFRHVVVEAGPLTSWLASIAGGWAKNADDAARAGRENGKLADYLERTRDVLKRLGSIAAHTAAGLLGVGKAATDSGEDSLKSIDEVAKRFDTWANSLTGQSSLKEFFKDSRELIANLIPALEGIGKATLKLGFGPLSTALKIAGPYAEQLTYAFIGYKIAAGAAAIATGAYRAATWLAAAGQWALNAAMSANPIGLIVIGLAALGAGLVYAYKKSETFRDIVDGAFGVLKDAFGWVKDNWQLLLAILAGPIGLAVLAISKHADDIVGFFKDLPDRVAGAIKAGASAFASAATWVKDQVVGGIKAFAGAIGDVGKWILEKIIGGIKTVTDLLGTVGGWIKNRIEELVHAAIDGFKDLGSWIVNRIVDGFKTVTDLLGTVGGWLKNRIEELAHAAIDGFKGVGGWILNRIVEGITTVTELLGTVGGWLKNRIKDTVELALDGFTAIGGWIMEKIVAGLKGGANLFIGFVNDLIDIINEIPGVDIGHVKKLAEGGVHAAAAGGAGKGTAAFARGGAFARTRGIVAAPITLMGEEAPLHPEFVIPTNPAYRKRAQQLLMRAAEAVGFANGGVYAASYFGGHDDPSAFGRRTASGAIANDSLWGFAELSNPPGSLNFSALGGLPMGTKVSITYGGRTAKDVPKVDVGAGGPGVGGHVRAVDMTYAVAKSLGFSGSGLVDVAIGGGDKDGGGLLGAIGGAVSGAADAVSGAVSDLVSKGAGFLLDQLPGVGDLPDWLKGTGKYLLSKATSWIKEKVGGLIPGGGGGGSSVAGYTGPPADEKRLGDAAWVDAHTLAVTAFLDRKFGLTQSSGYRSPEHNAEIGGAPGSHHTRGTPSNPGATDSVGPLSAMNEMVAYARQHVAGLVEAMVDNYAGLGFNAHLAFFARGGKYGPPAPGVISGPFLGTFHNGGVAVSDGFAYVQEGERMTPRSQQHDAEFSIEAVEVYIGGERIDERVDVRIRRRERESAAEFGAGVA